MASQRCPRTRIPAGTTRSVRRARSSCPPRRRVARPSAARRGRPHARPARASKGRNAPRRRGETAARRTRQGQSRGQPRRSGAPPGAGAPALAPATPTTSLLLSSEPLPVRFRKPLQKSLRDAEASQTPNPPVFYSLECGRAQVQPPDRNRAVRQRGHRQDPPQQPLPQVGGAQPHAGCREGQGPETALVARRRGSQTSRRDTLVAKRVPPAQSAAPEGPTPGWSGAPKYSPEPPRRSQPPPFGTRRSNSFRI